MGNGWEMLNGKRGEHTSYTLTSPKEVQIKGNVGWGCRSLSIVEIPPFRGVPR